ncbi:hypothetical protein [Streptomyces sp. NBC_01451]|nr:hypothetical protein [Streptomyces sp. NBC_01451]
MADTAVELKTVEGVANQLGRDVFGETQAARSQRQTDVLHLHLHQLYRYK